MDGDVHSISPNGSVLSDLCFALHPDTTSRQVFIHLRATISISYLRTLGKETSLYQKSVAPSSRTCCEVSAVHEVLFVFQCRMEVCTSASMCLCGRTGRINNLRYFRFICLEIRQMFYFEKLPDSLSSFVLLCLENTTVFMQVLSYCFKGRSLKSFVVSQSPMSFFKRQRLK